MPTQNPRLNITLDTETHLALAFYAKKQKKSMSAYLKKLLEQALRDEEDFELATEAKKRLDDIKSGKSETIPHDEFWRIALKDAH